MKSFSLPEVARSVGVSPRTLRRKIAAGDVRVPGMVQRPHRHPFFPNSPALGVWLSANAPGRRTRLTALDDRRKNRGTLNARNHRYVETVTVGHAKENRFDLSKWALTGQRWIKSVLRDHPEEAAYTLEVLKPLVELHARLTAQQPHRPSRRRSRSLV
jgi:hypothetical protein